MTLISLNNIGGKKFGIDLFYFGCKWVFTYDISSYTPVLCKENYQINISAN